MYIACFGIQCSYTANVSEEKHSCELRDCLRMWTIYTFMLQSASMFFKLCSNQHSKLEVFTEDLQIDSTARQQSL